MKEVFVRVMYSISVAFVGRCTIKKKLIIFLLRSVNNKTSQFVYLYLRIIIKIYRDCEKKYKPYAIYVLRWPW